MIDFIELCLLAIIFIRIQNLHTKGNKQMATLKDRFDAMEVRIDEATTELVNELQTLRDALANANTELSPDAEASLSRIEGKINALADVVPNAAPAPTPEPPAEDQPTA